MRQKDSAEAAITIAAFVFEVISNSGLWQLRGPMAERVKRVVSCQLSVPGQIVPKRPFFCLSICFQRHRGARRGSGRRSGPTCPLPALELIFLSY